MGGAGQIMLENLRFTEADPLALPRVLAIPPHAIEPIDENRIGAIVSGEMKKAPFTLPRSEAPMTVLNGKFRVGGKSPIMRPCRRRVR